jgi:hypothetical protein
MNIRLLSFILLNITVLSPVKAQEFRNFMWGTKSEDIILIEGEPSSKVLIGLSYASKEFLGYNAETEFILVNNKLDSGLYLITNLSQEGGTTTTPPTSCIEAYSDIKRKLSILYGASTSPGQESNQLSSTKAYEETQWSTTNSFIRLAITHRSTGKWVIVINYYSPMYVKNKEYEDYQRRRREWLTAAFDTVTELSEYKHRFDSFGLPELRPEDFSYVYDQVQNGEISTEDMNRTLSAMSTARRLNKPLQEVIEDPAYHIEQFSIEQFNIVRPASWWEVTKNALSRGSINTEISSLRNTVRQMENEDNQDAAAYYREQIEELEKEAAALQDPYADQRWITTRIFTSLVEIPYLLHIVIFGTGLIIFLLTFIKKKKGNYSD